MHLVSGWNYRVEGFFLFARDPFTDFAFSISSNVGSCINWSNANPPTVNVFIIHSGAGCPRSGATLTATSMAKRALIPYTNPSPIRNKLEKNRITISTSISKVKQMQQWCRPVYIPPWKHSRNGVGKLVNGKPGYSTNAISTNTNDPMKCPTCSGPNGIDKNGLARSPRSALTTPYCSSSK